MTSLDLNHPRQIDILSWSWITKFIKLKPIQPKDKTKWIIISEYCLILIYLRALLFMLIFRSITKVKQLLTIHKLFFTLLFKKSSKLYNFESTTWRVEYFLIKFIVSLLFVHLFRRIIHCKSILLFVIFIDQLWQFLVSYLLFYLLFAF